MLSYFLPKIAKTPKNKIINCLYGRNRFSTDEPVHAVQGFLGINPRGVGFFFRLTSENSHNLNKTPNPPTGRYFNFSQFFLIQMFTTPKKICFPENFIRWNAYKIGWKNTPNFSQIFRGLKVGDGVYTLNGAIEKRLHKRNFANIKKSPLPERRCKFL